MRYDDKQYFEKLILSFTNNKEGEIRELMQEDSLFDEKSATEYSSFSFIFYTTFAHSVIELKLKLVFYNTPYTL